MVREATELFSRLEKVSDWIISRPTMDVMKLVSRLTEITGEVVNVVIGG